MLINCVCSANRDSQGRFFYAIMKVRKTKGINGNTKKQKGENYRGKEKAAFNHRPID